MLDTERYRPVSQRPAEGVYCRGCDLVRHESDFYKWDKKFRQGRCRSCFDVYFKTKQATKIARGDYLIEQGALAQCRICGSEKLLAEFRYRPRYALGRRSICKGCEAVAAKKKREDFPDLVNGWLAKSRSACAKICAEYLIRHLAAHPCVDCGEADLLVLQFDHVRGRKEFNISHALGSKSMKRLRDEVAKCDVRCANCHQRETFLRRGKSWRITAARDLGIQI